MITLDTYMSDGRNMVYKDDPVFIDVLGMDFGNYEAKWTDPVLAHNGRIYCCPAGAVNSSGQAQVIEIDPTTKSARYIALAYTVAWTGGALAKNGNIYFAPNSASKVLEVNPFAGTTTLIGTDFGSTIYKWWGAILAPNGFIYCMPRDDTHILRIDPINKTTQRVGTAFASGLGKFYHGVLAANGKIYALSFTLKKMLEFNPETNEILLISPNIPFTDNDYIRTNLTLAPNGKIYAPAATTTRSILEFNPENKEFVLIGDDPRLYNQHFVVGPNGLLYSTPNKNGMYSFNVYTKEIKYYEAIKFPDAAIYPQYREGCLAPNGKIYYSPFSGNKCLEVDMFPKSTDFQSYLKLPPLI